MAKRENRSIGIKEIFYCLILFIIVFAVFGIVNLPSEKHTDRGSSQILEVEWYQVLNNGEKKLINVPGKCSAEKGETVIIETTLPIYIEGGKYLCFRSSQQDMRVYVDGNLRQEYSTKDSRLFGKTSASGYVFVPLYDEDDGKVLRVETESVSNHSGTMNAVYYGDRFGIWEYLAGLYGAELAIAFIMLVLAIICIFFSIILRCFHNKKVVFEYLGWGILLVAIWIISENRLRQLLFENISLIASVTFFVLMLLPMPFAIYVNSIQQFRYDKWYKVIYLIILTNFAVCTGLQLFNIKDFFETMLIMHIVLILSFLMVAFTIILDIKNQHIHSYKLVAHGLAVLMITGIIEIANVYFNNGMISGYGVCSGLIYLLAMAAIKTGNEVLSLERERQMVMMDNESKTSFLTKMSHEIRTPINTIIGMNEMIARENKDKTIEQYVIKAQDASRTLLALVNDVLDFSRMEAGHLNLTENVYQLSSLINDEVHMIQARAQAKNLIVDVNVDKNLPSYLYGDEVRIKQIISNLLSNAVKYTEEGSITFSVGYINGDDGRFYLKISVADTGVGIKNEDIEHVFESFAKLDEKKNTHIAGAGLGLYIIKQLIDEMNGEIKVNSIYGKGSLFVASIPQTVIDKEPIGMLSDDFKTERTQLKQYRASFTASKAKILAVDDNEMNLAVVKGFLKQTQVQLDMATSGEQCLLLCKDKKYDVIIMDHMMPEPNGIQTLRMLRENPTGNNFSTPVVALTANAVAGSREAYLAEGFEEYLSKPIAADKLESVLMRLIPEELITLKNEEEESKEEILVNNFVVDEEGEISRSLGLSYCNYDEEMYEELLTAYYSQGKIYTEKLPEYYALKDWKNYAITTHAMKSTSLNIGAREFSEMAKRHEMAGKEENVSWIDENWPDFYASYLNVLNAVEKMMPSKDDDNADKQELTIASKEEYKKECELLIEYLSNYEMNASIEQLSKLKTLQIADMDVDKRNKLFNEIAVAIDDFDYAKAEELLTEWMKGV